MKSLPFIAFAYVPVIVGVVSAENNVSTVIEFTGTEASTTTV